LPEADVEQINLAQPLSDAMKVMVPRKGQVLAVDQYAAPPLSSDGGPFAGTRHRGRHSRGGSRSAHKLAPGQTLDVNTATADELVQLPGVGPGLAQRILDYRQQYGPFQTVDDLQNVPGIGPSKFDRLAPFVRL
jgi:competence protein ComEA